ncbi:MAG: 30S ribosomal protein S20 [Nitrospirae bacterium]|nr:MAG: 30S ribosomal protein S20 [Nitrospirota bacterium]
MAKKNLSALKRVRQAEKRRLRNQMWKSQVKTYTKKVLQAIAEKDENKAREVLRMAIRIISKAASKGVLHRNNASRRISRLTRKVNSAFSKKAA